MKTYRRIVNKCLMMYVCVCLIMVYGGCNCVNTNEHKKTESMSVLRFECKEYPNGVLNDEASGTYIHYFDAGMTLVDIKLSEKKYRYRIIWKTGKTTTSEWYKCNSSGAGDPNTYMSVLFYDFPMELVRLERPPQKNGFPSDESLAYPLSDAQMEEYPLSSYSASIGKNFQNEFVVGPIGVDPDYWFVRDPLYSQKMIDDEIRLKENQD